MPSPPKSIPSSDPPKLADAIAAYNKLMDAEESLVEVVGLDGRGGIAGAATSSRRTAPPSSCWGLDDVDDPTGVRDGVPFFVNQLKYGVELGRLATRPPRSCVPAPAPELGRVSGFGAGSAVSIGAHSTAPVLTTPSRVLCRKLRAASRWS